MRCSVAPRKILPASQDAYVSQERGQSAQAQGVFCKALDLYEEVKQTAGDLALAEYARDGHAVTLYEVGDRRKAINRSERLSRNSCSSSCCSVCGQACSHASRKAVQHSDVIGPSQHQCEVG